MALTHINPVLGRLLELFRLDVAFATGEGAELRDTGGRRFLDFTAQYGALPLGHNPPAIWAALEAAREAGVPSLVQPSVPTRAVQLAERLAALAPGDLSIVTFVQSGAEAVETAIKMVRARSRRSGILSTIGGFHGKTLGALSATPCAAYQAPFFAPAPGFFTVPYDDLPALETKLASIGNDLAGFIVEPVQAEAGVIVPDADYLRGAADLCRRYGVFLIVDEVQTGLGRTGPLFACESAGVVPDILLLAKGLGGGLVPLGACIARPDVWTEEFGLNHSSTFANNNVTCSAGLATLDVLTADGGALLRQAGAVGVELACGLRGLAARYPRAIAAVRSAGLLAAVEFRRTNGADGFHMTYFQNVGGFVPLLAAYLLRVHGLRTVPFFAAHHPPTLRLEPPLIVTSAQIQQALTAIGCVADLLERRDYVPLFDVLLSDEPMPPSGGDYAASDRPVRCSVRRADDDEPERYAFLVHYTSLDDMRVNNPCFRDVDPAWLERAAAMTTRYGKPGVLCHLPALRSKVGVLAEGWLIGVPYLPAQMLADPAGALRAVAQGVDLGRDLGARIVGLGAFTSIVSRSGQDVCGRGVGITTGTSLTVLSAVEAAFAGARGLGIDLDRGRCVVVGATGSVGRLASLLLAGTVGRLTLVGNPNDPARSLERLAEVADEIYRLSIVSAVEDRQNGITQKLVAMLSARRWGELVRDSEARGIAARVQAWLVDRAPVLITTELESAVRDADVIVSASSAVGSVIATEDLKPGAVVCDVARPPDVSHAVRTSRDDVLVIDGGLIELPDRVAFGQNLGLRPGVTLACLSETILLSLARHTGDFALGSSPSLDGVRWLRGLAATHGFRMAGPRLHGEEISAAHIATVRQRAWPQPKVFGRAAVAHAETR